MFKCLSYVIAIAVLAVVLCGLVHDECRQTIFTHTLGGLMVGVVHGILHVYCIGEVLRTGPSLTPRRIRKIVIHDVRMALVIGLLIGVINAVACMCGK